jgi:hypothetical protein
MTRTWRPTARLGLIVVALLLAACAPAPTSEGWEGCANRVSGYTVRIPDGWWSHPGDADQGVEPCSRFGPVPFDLADAEPGQLVNLGESVYIWVVDACLGGHETIFEPVLQEHAVVGGFPAVREELVSNNLSVYGYTVALRRDPGSVSCEVPFGALIQTRTDAPGDYDTNKRAVDVLASSIRFGR